MNINEDPKLSVLFKGQPGSGKTAAALSFPGPILLLYTDPNRETVRQAALSGKEVYIQQITSWREYEQFRQQLRAREFKDHEHQPQTIIVDTWDFLAEMAIEDIGGRDGKMQMQDWGKLFQRQKQAMLELVHMSLPMGDHPGYHIVVCLHTKENTDDEGRLMSVGPALQGQFKDKIEAYFDYVLLCEARLTRLENPDTKKMEPAKEFVIHSIPPSKHHTCKGGALPAMCLIPQGFSAFEELNKFWMV